MLNMIYLANDIIQNTFKKKDSKFPEAFFRVFPKVLAYARKHMEGNEKWNRISRVIAILDERQMIDKFGSKLH